MTALTVANLLWCMSRMFTSICDGDSLRGPMWHWGPPFWMGHVMSGITWFLFFYNKNLLIVDYLGNWIKVLCMMRPRYWYSRLVKLTKRELAGLSLRTVKTCEWFGACYVTSVIFKSNLKITLLIWTWWMIYFFNILSLLLLLVLFIQVILFTLVSFIWFDNH